MPTSPKADALEMSRDCLGSRARRLERVLTRIYDGVVREQGVTAAQVSMLVAIELGGPTNAAWVGRRLEIEKSTVSRNLARLLAAGLVEDADGLRVTARGAAMIRTCYPLWKQAQQQAQALLGPEAAKFLSGIGTKQKQATQREGERS
jgi:DNA-binding MarR family transcriptional regulator